MCWKSLKTEIACDVRHLRPSVPHSGSSRQAYFDPIIILVPTKKELHESTTGPQRKIKGPPVGYLNWHGNSHQFITVPTA